MSVSLKTRSSAAAPLYEKVKQYVLEKIESGEWTSANRLPGEPELARQLGISRMTINRALRELAGDQIVDRIPGVGTFVATEKPAAAIIEIHNIADLIRSRGQSYSSDVVELSKVAAPRDIRLGHPSRPNSRLYHARIVHRANGVALQLEDRYVSPEFAPDFLDQDFTRTSTTAYLYSIAPPTEANHVIEALMPDAATQKLLEMPAGEPVLVVSRQTWVGEKATTFMRLYHPGSRHRLISRTTAPHAGFHRTAGAHAG